jgi:hypothetical protein
MSRKRFKIHPALPLPGGQETPMLDPSKAPWSSPRGFATSIPEEVAAWHRAVRAAKPQEKPKPLSVKKQKPKSPKFSCSKFFKRVATAIYDHFQAITFSNDRHDHINNKMHRFIGTLCCIRSDVNAAISS